MLDNLGITDIVIAAICIIISLVIHEFMHAYVGYLLGDNTAKFNGRLTLNPLSHIDPVMTVALPILTLILFGYPLLAAKPVPFNPDRVKFDEYGAAMIAAAGPLSNLVLAIVGKLIILHVAMTGLVLEFVTEFTILNVALFVFNFIPLPPLDGSRVLYAFAPEPLQEFMSYLESYGLVIIFVLVYVAASSGVLQNLDQSVLNAIP
jgi:Zn-dependent protease